MAQLMDYVSYLTNEIGPRPAGTEEEQQAALYITEQFQKEAGFTSNIEEFESTSNLEGGQAVLAAVTIVVTILAIFFPVLSIFAFILAAAAAAIYALEAFDKPIVSRMLARGASQNVVAKYQPNPDEEASGRIRSRKLILVAHYDTGRVKPGIVSTVESMPVPWALVCVIAMIAAAVFLLLRVFVATSGGGALVILNIVSVIALLVCLLPVLKTILVRTSTYNEGANNNATGTAALIEVARRISRGSVSEADLANDDGEVTIHGEDAARSAGLIPEGAQLLYEAEQIEPAMELGQYDEEERLLAAKAAIAALTGKPVERKVYGSVADNLVNSHARGDAGEMDDQVQHDEIGGFAGQGGFDADASGRDSFAAADNSFAKSAVNEPVAMEPRPEADTSSQADSLPDDAEGFENAPSWFIAAQRNAKRTPPDDDEEVAVQRSRYTEAMERGERSRYEREQAELQAEFERQEKERQERLEKARAEVAALSGSIEQNPGVSSEPFEFEPVPELSTDYPDDPLMDVAYERGMRTMYAQLGREASAELAELKSEALIEEPAHSGDDPFEQPASSELQPAGASADDARIDARRTSGGAGRQTGRQAGRPAGDVAGTAVNDDPDSTHAFLGYAQLDDAEQADALDADNDSGFAFDSAFEQAPEASSGAAARRDVSIPEVEISQPGRHARVTNLPPIDANSKEPTASERERSNKRRALRTNVPSLSGVIRTNDEARKNAAAAVPNVMNVPTPMEASAPAAEADVLVDMGSDAGFDASARRRLPATAPSGNGSASSRVPASSAKAKAKPAAQDVDYDMEVAYDYDDAYDDAYDDEYGSDFDDVDRYDDMSDPAADKDDVVVPKSRARGFFDRFRKNDDDLQETPQEWLDVDEDFDARSVGRARGSWESFRDDGFDGDPFDQDNDDGFGDFAMDDAKPARRQWEGGAYSRTQLGHVNMRSGEGAEADEIIPDEPPEAEVGRSITGEIEQIYHFRNPSFNTEIWFVAVGSDNDAHDGAKAFLAEHHNELRGSMVIEIESLGAGELSVAAQEGKIKKVNASSRIKRLTRDATARTGINLGTGNLSGIESIASTIQKAGFQSMHLFGAENGRPALKGSPDDVLDNVDEELLEENVNFIYELLKHQ